ncbi:DUF58 domain-containing protein [Stygiobacter electus]|uniref:DUF58 domain-containing protein n=1 Tax=Stygiobacter electus TaxID=3032292 RepID=A0AAE3NZG4_9BACT|nr:DUF58 domain-containing protein [Stygiobacter electus]MDF1612906.1 DUF58 domain-containing protein [Stygiobacter electus]
MSIKKADVKKYLDPEVISGLKSLELRAKMIVEGFMVGLHRSPYHGFSVEFAEYRPYIQGDSIRNIDWKVFAKTEKYYLKKYEDETNLICNIFIDCSKSMNFKHSAKVTKLDYAINLAAALSYILINQQDSVGLVVYSDNVKEYLQPKSSRFYLKTIFTELANIKSDGKTNTSIALNSIADKIKKRGLTIIISDFFDDLNSTISAIKKIHFKKNEIIIFQILDPIEINFGFERDSTFIDLETNEKLSSQPHHIQLAYQEAMNEFLTKLKRECLNLNIDYNLIETNQTFEKALLSYFAKREKLH